MDRSQHENKGMKQFKARRSVDVDRSLCSPAGFCQVKKETWEAGKAASLIKVERMLEDCPSCTTEQPVLDRFWGFLILI